MTGNVKDLLNFSKPLNLMALSPVPTESKRAINRAAEAVVKGEFKIEDIDLINKWRACHAYPINTFQSTLRFKLKKYEGAIVAQRLKRFITIIGKLTDDSRLTLTTMQDIAGVRAILRSVREVYRLSNDYRTSPYFANMIELGSCKDYIQAPKRSGYRGIHLIFKYQNKLNPAYDGLRVEMQIRTKLQHTWATAVEVMQTFRGEKLKSGKGDEKWQYFFSLVSSYFAHQEKCHAVFPDLDINQTQDEIKKIEQEIGAIELMSGFSLAANAIHQSKGQGRSFYLITLDSNKKTVELKPYDRKSFSKAFKDLQKAEAQARENNQIEVVLVASGKVETLKKAYPNYFLDTAEFVARVVSIRDTILAIPPPSETIKPAPNPKSENPKGNK